MQTSVNQRINYLIEHFEGGNKSAFGRRVDMKSGVVGDLVGGRMNKPSFDALIKILEAYPSVSTDWLVLGRGPILRNLGSDDKPKPDSNADASVIAEQPEQLIDIIKREVAEQMALNLPLSDVYRMLNDELARKRADYEMSWQIDAEEIREKLAAFGDVQTPDVPELTNRLEAIERAISVLHTIKNEPDRLSPSIAYRIGNKPDYSKPFDGLLTRRLNMTEDEVMQLIALNEIGYASMDGYGYEVNEDLVQRYLRKNRRIAYI